MPCHLNASSFTEPASQQQMLDALAPCDVLLDLALHRGHNEAAAILWPAFMLAWLEQTLTAYEAGEGCYFPGHPVQRVRSK